MSTPSEPENWWTTDACLAALARAQILVTADDAERVGRYLAARRRGTDWLLARMRPDGALGDPAAGFEYYRAPWTFGLVGAVEAAHAVCGFVRRNLLTADGRLDGPLRVVRSDWAYRDATFILGAHQIGEYDLSYGLTDELLRWQDPASGAFANDRLPDGSMSDDMNVPYACGPGFAALAVGRLDAARRVAGFLRMIWGAQTLDAAGGLPSRFYSFWSRSRQRPIVPSDPDFKADMVVAKRRRPDAALDGRRHRRGLSLPPVPCRSRPGVPRSGAAVPGVFHGGHRRPVQVPLGLQVELGQRPAVPGDRRGALPPLGDADGRLVRGDSGRGGVLAPLGWSESNPTASGSPWNTSCTSTP